MRRPGKVITRTSRGGMEKADLERDRRGEEGLETIKLVEEAGAGEKRVKNEGK